MDQVPAKEPVEILEALSCLNLSAIGIDPSPLTEVIQDLIAEADTNNVSDFLCNVNSDESPILIELIASSIPWDDPDFISNPCPKEVIRQCIQDEVLTYISRKPFTFHGEIYYDDDHYNEWYAELYPSDFLTEKLEKKIQAKKPNSVLCSDPTPEFFATYDLIKGTVSVLSRCTVIYPPNQRSDTVSVPLASREYDLLISCIENACRQQYSGKDCLTVLNEKRQTVGMDPLKQALAGRIRFFQNIDASSTNTNLFEPFIR